MAWRDITSTRALFRPLPWWIVVGGSFFILLKLHLAYVGTACAVLGMNERLDSSAIKKKFRQISMCTHPDRLRGRLKRSPTEAEVRRGQVLFNRASVSKDELQEMLARATRKKTKKKKINGKWVTEILDSNKPEPIIYCRERSAAEVSLRRAIRDFSREIKEYFESTGLSSNVEGIVDYFWGVVSFQQGVMGTIISLAWLSFFYKMIKSFLVWMWDIGVSAPFYLVQVGVLAPIPTVLRFFYLPMLRILVYAEQQWPSSVTKYESPEVSPEVSSHSGTEADEPDSSRQARTSRPTTPSETVTSTAEVAAAKELGSGVRRRKRIKASEEMNRRAAREEKHERHIKKLLRERGDYVGEDGGAEEDICSMSGRDLISRTMAGKEQRCRAVGAKNIQVELMVILTKPILPLIMVVLLGQVWSGFLMSMVMWEAYRRIPTFFYEYHHVICMVFGFIHTWIGVTASEVERQAENENTALRLQWEWSYRDCIVILFLCLIGAENTVYSALGNEPSYTSSFASGIALRIMFECDFIRNLSVSKWAQDFVTRMLAAYGIQVATQDEQLIYGGGGVGDCGGGTIEMLVGEDWSSVVAGTVQIALCTLPLLYASMWLQRGLKGISSVKGSHNKYTKRFPRICARIALGVGGLLQVALCIMVSLNTSHGGLYNFWLSMLIGVWLESMISTYDIRGPIRSLFFLLIICFV